MPENKSDLDYSTMSKEDLLNSMSNQLQKSKIDYSTMSKSDLLNSMSNSLDISKRGVTVSSKEELLKEMEMTSKGHPQPYDLSNGTANVPIQKYMKVFTPEMDDILSSNSWTDEGLLKPARSLKYGYLSSASNFYNLISNIPGGINRFKNFLTGQTSKSPDELLMSDDINDKLNVFEQAEKFLKTVAYDVAPKGYTDERLIDKIYMGVGAAPVTIGEYLPATRIAGVVAKPLAKATPTLNKLNQKYWGLVNPTSMGIAGTDFVAQSDKGFGDASIAGIKGLILGNALKGTEGLSINTRMTTLGIIGFGSTEGSFDDRVSGAVTFSLLGGFGRLEGRTLKELNRDFKDTYEFRKGVMENTYSRNYIESVDKLKDEFRREDSNIKNYWEKSRAFKEEYSKVEKALTEGDKNANPRTLDDLQVSIDRYDALLNAELKRIKITRPFFDIITKEKMDIRNPEEVFKDLFYVDEAGNNKNKYQDIKEGTLPSLIGKYMLPVKFFKNHPLTKYVADRISRSSINSTMRFNDIIKSDKINDVKYKYEGDVRERFSFIPGMTFAKIKADPNSYEGTLKNITSQEAFGVMKTMIEIEQRYIDFVNAKGKEKQDRSYFFDEKGDAKVDLVEKEYKLNTNQMKHYLAKRYAYDAAHDSLIKVLKELGGNTKIPTRLPNFIVHAFAGDYRVYANKSTDKGNVVVKTFGVDNIKQAEKLINNLKTIDSSLEYSYAKRNVPTDNRALNQFAEVFGYIKNDSKATEALDTAYRNFLLKNLPKHFLKRRKDRYVTGFSGTNPFKTDIENVQDFHRAEIQYFDGLTQAIERMKFDADVNFVLNFKGVARKMYPNAVRLSQDIVNNAYGKDKSKISETIDKLVQNHLKLSGGAKFFDGLNRVTLVSKLLAYNVRFGFASFLQPYQMVMPNLRRLNDLGITDKNPWESLFQAYRDMFLPNKEVKEAIKYFAGEGGLASAKFLDEFNSADFLGKIQVSTKDVLTKSGKKKFGKGRGLELLSGKKIAAHIEMYSRTIAGLMFYNHYRSAGLDPVSARKNAAYQANNAMVEYDAELRPLLYGPTANFGYLGKSAGLFKTFQHNYLAQMVEYVKVAQQTGNITGLQGFVASMIMYSGLLGVVGIGAVDQLIRTINYIAKQDIKDATTFLMEQGFPDWALFGIASSAINTNLSTTTAAPGLSTDTLLSFPGIDYVAGIGKEIAVLSSKLLSGTASFKDFLVPAKAAAPSSLHGIIELYYNALAQGKPVVNFLNGDGEQRTMYLDMKKDLRAYPPRSIADWYKKVFLTATSVDEARKLKALFHYTRWKAQNDTVIAGYVAYATSYFLASGGEAIPQDYYDLMASEGKTPKQAEDYILNKLKSIQNDALSQLLEKTPKNIQDIENSEMLNKMLGNQ